MEIKLNGESQQIASGSTLAQLVHELDLEGKRIAIEINEVLVPRSSFKTHQINAGDEIEIVQAIGGG